MNQDNDRQKVRGSIQILIDHVDGRHEELWAPNAVLNLGRQALAAGLANEIGTNFDFFIARMLFGDGGAIDGEPQVVDAGRTGLFGATRVNKGVVSQVNAQNLSQAIFTSVVTYQEGNGFALNEMALQMNTGDLFSMATFPDLNKTEQMQITFNWYSTFV
jgi:hypothetical protein